MRSCICEVTFAFGSCDTVDDLNARVCVPNKVINMNVKILSLISVVNEARFLVQHESCEYRCGLNKSVCNSKQICNYNECRCDCKVLNGWCSCEKGYMQNPNTCACECK